MPTVWTSSSPERRPTPVTSDGAANGQGEAAELDRILRWRLVDPLFQPIVDLRTGDVVAYEALARGPEGGALRRPEVMFAAARAAGRTEDLDRLCRDRALEEASAAGLTGPVALFVNIEPAGLSGGRPFPTPALTELRERGVMIFAEITERALTDDPAGLLAYADRVRATGGHVALDDVGANRESLALMPFLQPDVIKLDLRLVQDRPDETVAETMTAVTAHAERSGAWVLAEGIETERHERVARSLGATLGQGWRYGRGTARPGAAPAPAQPLVLTREPITAPARSPFETAARSRTPQPATKSLLVEVSKLLERQAHELHGVAVVLSAFEHARYLPPSTLARYAELASSAAFVVALGAGVPAEPAPGVRGADLDPSDPVVGEWDVVVVGPHFAAALVARDLQAGLPEPNRTFDYVLTYDREVVLAVARSLMSRALPVTEAPVPG